jgi:hypothetical protein
MVGQTDPITRQDRERFTIIKQHCGCLCCLLMGWLDVHASIEHITEAGRRRGHRASLGLCGWHHFGTCHRGRHKPEMTRDFGPSLANGRKPFEEYFGDELEILLPIQNYLLDRFAADPWPEYNLPGNVAIDTRNRWIELNHATAQSLSRPAELSD